MDKKSYIRGIAQQIRVKANQASSIKSLDELFDSYAVLALAKGDEVTNRDVHNAWSAWATEYEPDSAALVPFEELSREVQDIDTRFAEAIRHVATVIDKYDLTPAKAEHAEAMAEFDSTKYELPSDVADSSKLNKLRAAVLGANDGIVSVSSITMGMVGATNDARAISLAGLAALIAGALSMAVGEYVSVSSQADAEKAYVTLEKKDLRDRPEHELDELAREYQKLGVSRETAEKVAGELTAKDALRAHLHVHFNLDPDDINSPWQAAIASLIAFTAGGLVPFLVVVLVPHDLRVPATAIAVLVALISVGLLSAVAGKAPKWRAVARVVIGGFIAMVITYGVGSFFGHSF